jgi:hypothetical protein
VSGVRRAFEFFVGRILKSRYGLALLLAGLVFLIVSGARLLGGGEPAGGALGSRGEGGLPSATATAAADDGLTSPAPPAPPMTSPGTAKPLAVARAFAEAWVHHDVSTNAWYAALLPHTTRELAAKLDGVDPARVPADRVTGEPTLVPRGSAFVEVTIPVDSGLLRLRLVAPEGRWLVDGVDWERA